MRREVVTVLDWRLKRRIIDRMKQPTQIQRDVGGTEIRQYKPIGALTAKPVYVVFNSCGLVLASSLQHLTRAEWRELLS